MYVVRYICGERESMFLLGVCSVLMGLVGMVVMMVKVLRLMVYGGGIEGYLKIKGGVEGGEGEGWDKVDIEGRIGEGGIYVLFMILGEVGRWVSGWVGYEYEWEYVY